MNKCSEFELFPVPTDVVTDFEKASLQAVTAVLSEHIATQGSFYRFTQHTPRKVRELRFANAYRQLADTRKFVGMVDGLAFLPLDQVTDSTLIARCTIAITCLIMKALRCYVVPYLDTTFVYVFFRRVQRTTDGNIHRVVIRRIPPQFPPPL